MTSDGTTSSFPLPLLVNPLSMTHVSPVGHRAHFNDHVISIISWGIGSSCSLCEII